MEKQKSNCSCEKVDLESLSECTNIVPLRTISKIKMALNGNCYDQYGNFLGKAQIIEGRITIKIERSEHF